MKIDTHPNFAFVDNLAPLTVIGGDMASGKTTLLSYIAQRHSASARLFLFSPKQVFTAEDFPNTEIVDHSVVENIDAVTCRREVSRLLASAHEGDIVMIDESALVLSPRITGLSEVMGVHLYIVDALRRGVRVVVTCFTRDYDTIAPNADTLVECHYPDPPTVIRS